MGSKRGNATHDPHGHRHQPAYRGQRSKIRQAIGQPNQVKCSPAEGETQQGAKLEISAKARGEDRKRLPPKKNSPEKQRHPSGASLGDELLRPGVEAKAQTEHQQPRRRFQRRPSR